MGLFSMCASKVGVITSAYFYCDCRSGLWPEFRVALLCFIASNLISRPLSHHFNKNLRVTKDVRFG